jgi:hypothetical protein
MIKQRTKATSAKRLPKKRKNPNTLKKELNELRSDMVNIAQKIYDDWEEDEFEGGICDLIADEISSLIDSKLSNIEIFEGGHDGDDHAWIIIERDNTQYGVNIPSDVYEVGGGYNWRKRKNVIFDIDDIEIFKI